MVFTSECSLLNRAMDSRMRLKPITQQLGPDDIFDGL
jgi:hypothetical protein